MSDDEWINGLRKQEKKFYSQHGEDGVLEAVFQRVGTTNKIYVEFGVQDCTECISRYLR